MTSITIDSNEIMACLSQEMIDKLQYACQAFITELLIIKKYKEHKSKKQEYTYTWFTERDNNNTGKITHRTVSSIIDRMFHNSNDALLLSVISDYAVPEDVPMLRRFMDNYYIHVYKVPQLTCDQLWRDRFINNPDEFNSTTFPTMIFKHGMYYYTQLNTEFVRHNLFNVVVDNDLVQLK